MGYTLAMRLDFDFGSTGGARRVESRRPRMLVVADLMGARAGEAPPIDSRRVVRIDAENFDEVLARIGPALEVGAEAPLRFDELDDFHPDALFEKVPLFDRLRELRERLQRPDAFAAAVAELRAEAPARGSSDDGFLDRLLGREGAAPQIARDEAGLEGFVRSLVTPHLVAGDDPQLPQYLSAVDTAIGDAMRGLLHDPAFQRLEAAWRGVRWLTAEAGEETVDLFLLQATSDELRSVPLHDEVPWDLVVIDRIFDEQALDRLQGLAASGQPLVAGASDDLVGGAEPPQAWNALRARPEARSVALVWPRVLLRLPYGRRSDPIDAFEFEELPAAHDHDDYLWGNGAFAAALVKAQEGLGSAAVPGELDGLPAYTYVVQGETTLKPCAERLLPRATIEQVAARGISPLLSIAGRDAVRLLKLQSIRS